MRNTDVAIVGSGLAGSAVAAMLGRAGVDIAVIDPHPIYHKEFRCEKLENDQIATLLKTGLSEAVFDVSPQINEIWIVPLGHLVRKLRRRQRGFMYDTFVNTLRAQIPPHVTRITSKASTIITSDDRQKISLVDNEEISARLVVLATGLNDKPSESLGFRAVMRLDLDIAVAGQAHQIVVGHVE